MISETFTEIITEIHTFCGGFIARHRKLGKIKLLYKIA